MPETNTGAIYGVKALKHNGKALGLISEDGLQPGGDSPSKTRIWAAQKRNAPFAVLKSTPGTKTWTFTLIELSADNMIQVMGGTKESTGIYVPPTEDKDVQGVFDIETVTGHTIRIYNGVLTCNVLGIECELEMQEAGENPPYKIFAPGDVVPEYSES